MAGYTHIVTNEDEFLITTNKCPLLSTTICVTARVIKIVRVRISDFITMLIRTKNYILQRIKLSDFIRQKLRNDGGRTDA